MKLKRVSQQKIFTQQVLKKNTMLLIGSLFLCSCTVGPDFIKPNHVSTKTYTDKSLKKLGNQRLLLDKHISPDWWKEFHSPMLNQLMTHGIKHNYSLKAAQHALSQTRELVNAAQGQLWPQVNMNTAIGRQQYGAALFGPINFKIPPFTYYEIGPSLAYTLDVFGGTRRTIEKQRALALYQQYELDATFLTLTGNIATHSLMIAAIKAQLDATKNIIREDEKNLHFVKKAFEMGAVTRTQILSAESQLTNDKTLLPELYQQLKVKQDALSILLGVTPVKAQTIQFKLDEFTLPRDLPLNLPSELIHKRPDILAAEANLHAACADVGIATAHLYPNITISANLLQEGLIPGTSFGISPNAWSVLTNLTTPVFSGGTLRAQRRASIHAYQATAAIYQQTVLKAFAEVSDALYALKHDAQALSLQKKALATAKESVRLSRLSFSAGNVGVLEILYAERLYAQAQLGYVNAKAQQYLDTIQLYLVLGGGLVINDNAVVELKNHKHH